MARQFFEWELLSGEYIEVQYEFEEGDPESGTSDNIEFWVTDFQDFDISFEIDDKNYERIRKKCFSHWEETVKKERDEWEIARWESRNG